MLRALVSVLFFRSIKKAQDRASQLKHDPTEADMVRACYEQNQQLVGFTELQAIRKQIKFSKLHALDNTSVIEH